ncbi:MAG: N-acetylneuraminate synthase family protein [Rhodocyclaceae bacterium]|nr:N-acetylneuraminate synthase family protein [Rhodocyclaceae bacterium]
MARITLRNGRQLGDYLAPYIVAELNTSHFGNPEAARAMIDSARAAGVDCVKFQSWTTDTLYSATHYRQNPIAKRFVSKFSLSDSQLRDLADYCRTVGMDFSSTPYAREEARFLAEACEVPFIKIASMELDNLPYLKYLARLQVPLVLSTGMGTIEEIRRAVETILDTGNEALAILHCVSVYPAAPESIRLHNILGLRSEFPDCPIGYSDHTQGVEIPTAAVALGACLIEKHFTLDKGKIGMDNQMATEPAEMAAMVRQCRSVQVSLGGASRILDEAEAAQRPKMRRSLITTRALPAGHVLQAGDLDAKRPGTGFPPTRLEALVGKTLAVALEADEVIEAGHLAHD